MEIDPTLIRSVFYALLAAVWYGLISYAAREDPNEIFKGPKFIKTLLVAILTGLLAVIFDFTPEEAFTAIMAEGFIVVTIEKAANIIWRRLSPVLQPKPPP